MNDRLKGKVAVITGGTSGIGEATVKLFVQEGAQVLFSGRSTEKGRAIEERTGAIYHQADVMSEEDIRNTIQAATDHFGGLDILFNNAGGSTKGLIETVTTADINYAWTLLFSSAVLSTKYAVPCMKRRGGGCIINNSSIAGLRDNQGDLMYSSVKAALTHYSKLAGTRLGPEGIRVNVISPGAIATPIFWGGAQVPLKEGEYEGKMRKLQRNLAKASPLGSSGVALDIANGALFLASEEGRFINSHDLVIDGGRTSMFFEKSEQA